MILLHVIGQIFNNKDLVGYRILDVANKTVKDFRIEDIPKLLLLFQGSVEFANAVWKDSSGILIGTQGSLTNYQSIYSNGVLFGKKKVTVLYKIKDSDTNKTVGYGVCDGYGMTLNVKTEKLIELCSKYEPSNFEFKVNKAGNNVAAPLGEKKFVSYKMQTDFEAVKGYNSKLGEKRQEKKDIASEIKVSNHSNMLPTVNIYSFDDIKSSEFSSQAQDKMFQAYSNLKKLSPYYHTLVMNVKRVASNAVPTLGVTEDTMYYNTDFVATLKVSQLTYILIHEVDHMAMRHAARHGDRDNYLWNIATDLYINSVISRDFDCYYGGGEVEVQTPSGKAYIETPTCGVHLSTIGEELDFGKDTPETIYDRLLKENPQIKNMMGNSNKSSKGKQSGQGQGQGQGQSQSLGQQIQNGVNQVMQGAQQAQQNSGNSPQSQQGQQQIQQGAKNIQQGMQNGNMQQIQQGAQQIQNGINQMNQAQNQAGQGGKPQGQSASNQMQNGMNQINDALNNAHQGQGQGQGQGDGSSPLDNNGKDVSSDRSKFNEDGMDVDQSDDYNSQSREVSVTYNGKKLTGNIHMDIMTNEIGDTKERNQRMQEQSLDATQSMKTAVEIAEQKLGESLTKNAGAGQGLMRRCIEFGLSTLVNWRALLTNMCKSKPKKMYTMASPNEAYMNAGITVASRRKIGKPTTITGIKVCIDVSGSVGEKELQYYLSEVNNILKHYEVEGELIYWSTMVGDAGNFSDLKDLLKVNPVTDGGTDVKCVFDYLAGKTRVNSKYEETRIRDISCIIIFTDGCFASNYAEYAKYFAKKVIWVIPDSRFTFNPCFGKVATMD